MARGKAEIQKMIDRKAEIREMKRDEKVFSLSGLSQS